MGHTDDQQGTKSGTKSGAMRATGPGVYVLELEGGRFYVGRSERSVARRIEQHSARDGSGAAFTQTYKVMIFQSMPARRTHRSLSNALGSRASSN